MIKGSCLCGAVKFEATELLGPFELCHCSRCRKVLGSAFLAGIYVKRDDIRFLEGEDSIQTYKAPTLEKPPVYQSCFCGTCGSPVPNTSGQSEKIEIPEGILDSDPGIRTDKHIYIEHKASWYEPQENT